MKKYGDRMSVFEGRCKMTRGGLTKKDLIVSKSGKIVSKKKSERAKENYSKYGFKKRKQEPDEPKKLRKRRKKKIKADEVNVVA